MKKLSGKEIMSNYKLDISKVKTMNNIIEIIGCMNLVASNIENQENYEILKKYFTIPCESEPIIFPKTIQDFKEKVIHSSNAGYWYFKPVRKRPKWIVRKLVKVLFNIEWKDT